MNVLFVVYDHYPDMGACTNLLNHLFFQGKLVESMDQISVLAVCSQYSRQKTICYQGIMVKYVSLWETFSRRDYRQLFPRSPGKVLQGCCRKMIDKIIQHYHPRAIHPQTVQTVQRALLQMEPEKYDVIVPVMGRIEIAVAALLLKKQRPDVKLVVYQVDPCATNEALPLSTQPQRCVFEGELYACSDRILTTPILLAEAGQRYGIEVTEKMTAMEFPNVIAQKEEISSCGSDSVCCSFVGNIYGDIRDPGYTLRLFDHLDDRIQFKITGSVCDAVKAECKKHAVAYDGPKPLDHTGKVFLESDVLVNIGNSMRNQVPSKLFEYISYGRPLVNICKNRDCPTIPYLKDYPYVLNLFEEEDLFEEQRLILREFILQNYQKRVPSEIIQKKYEACTPEFCARQMVGVFKDL